MGHGLSRRSFLRLAPIIAGAAAVPTAFFESMALVTVGKGPLAEVVFSHQTTGGEPEMARKVSEDLEKRGLCLKLRPLSLQAWLDAMTQRIYGDMTNRVKTRSRSASRTRSRCSSRPTIRARRSRRGTTSATTSSRSSTSGTSCRPRRSIPGSGSSTSARRRTSLPRTTSTASAPTAPACCTSTTRTGRAGSAPPARGWRGPRSTGPGLIHSESGKRRVVVGQPSARAHTNAFAPDGWSYEGQYVFDRLATLDQNLKIIPWALESFSSRDAVTWDVVLRRGMKWHDGRPVTPDDLKWTFDFKDAGYTWDGSGRLVFPAESDARFKKRVNEVVVQYPGQKSLYEPVL